MWPFVKMHGLGNDFVVVDERGREPFPIDVVRGLCDRHRGVGADGVLVVGASRVAGAAARMTVWNADGSAAEMCGNGIRCVARRLTREGPVVIDTDAGALACRVGLDGLVEVEMGRSVLEGPPDEPWRAGGRTIGATRVRIGNPHLVTFDAVDPGDRAVLAAALQRDPAFPGGINVEIAEVETDRIVLQVWERGVGFTQACGTGACATVVAACASGRVPWGRPVEVVLPGGGLVVTAPAADASVRMRGPAVQVFEGQLDL